MNYPYGSSIKKMNFPTMDLEVAKKNYEDELMIRAWGAYYGTGKTASIAEIAKAILEKQEEVDVALESYSTELKEYIETLQCADSLENVRAIIPNLWKIQNGIQHLYCLLDGSLPEETAHQTVSSGNADEKQDSNKTLLKTKAVIAEAKAEAIDEFAEKMKLEYVYIDVTSDDMFYGKYRKYINEIAEQLKGE